MGSEMFGDEIDTNHGYKRKKKFYGGTLAFLGGDSLMRGH